MGSGASTLTLTASNHFTGATTISAGTLVLGNANALQGSNVTDSVTKGGLAFATSGVQYNIGSLAAPAVSP